LVIIDTSIWIQAYRVKDSPERREVMNLVSSGEAAIVGIVLAEVLRGARNEREFEEMSEELLAAEFIDEDLESWQLTSRLLVELKLQGTTIPLADALIGAQALQGGHAVYTLDNHFQRIPRLRLHGVKA
jgi:predicted nucleic acid-binding protein